MSNYEDAVHLFKYYFRLAAIKQGIKWDNDNDVEIEAAIDSLINATIDRIKENKKIKDNQN